MGANRTALELGVRSLSAASLLQSAALVLMVIMSVSVRIVAAEAPKPAAKQTELTERLRKLDDLFARLKTVQAEAEGDRVIAEIWSLWLQSGDPQIDAAMQQAVMDHGIPALALPILDDIVTRAPDWAEGWNKRATVLYVMGEHDRSLADIRRVLALEPRHFGALAGMALIHIARGQNREALAVFRKALAVNPFLKERHSLMPALEKEIGEKPI